MKKFAKNILIVVIVIMSLTACLFAGENIKSQSDSGQKAVQYAQISYQQIRKNPSLVSWYQSNYQKQGIHYRRYKGDLYVIVSGGQKPTGGYTLLIRNVRRSGKDTAFIRARLIPPAPNMVVTQAITYPHLLIKINDQEIKKAEGVINERGGREDDIEESPQNQN